MYTVTKEQLDLLEKAIRSFDSEYDEIEEVIDLLRDIKGEEHYKEPIVPPFIGPPTYQEAAMKAIISKHYELYAKMVKYNYFKVLG